VRHDRNHDESQDSFSRHPREGGDPVTLVLTSSDDATKATAKSLGSRLRGNDEQKQKPTKPDPEAIEHVARVLLRRYGVVCWRLLEREAAWLPPWRELLRVYHRLEARGELRGGRFIAGLSGEQFALPDAVATLRRVRQRADDGEIVCVSASDPLNLAGTVLAGDKVPRLPGARVAYRDGVPVAALVAGEITSFAKLSSDDTNAVRRQLLRTPEPSAIAAFAMPD
jgi:ATP-dependent Lhr-like helicase